MEIESITHTKWSLCSHAFRRASRSFQNSYFIDSILIILTAKVLLKGKGMSSERGKEEFETCNKTKYIKCYAPVNVSPSAGVGGGGGITPRN